MSKDPADRAFLWMGLVAVLIGGASIWYKLKSPDRIENQVAKIHEDVQRESLEPQYTLSKFYAIKTGMKSAAVFEILGGGGTVMAESELAGYHTAIIGWQNADGGNLSVTFQNGRVVSKAQFGLR